jgi:hypothetical protein
MAMERANDSHEQLQRKKGKGKIVVNRVLEGAGTAGKVRHKPATRTLARIDSMSKSVGRGAGRLAATKVQGVFHQSLLGHGVQQVLMETTAAAGQPTWMEGSVEGVMWHHNSSAVQQGMVVQRAISTRNRWKVNCSGSRED